MLQYSMCGKYLQMQIPVLFIMNIHIFDGLQNPLLAYFIQIFFMIKVHLKWQRTQSVICLIRLIQPFCCIQPQGFVPSVLVCTLMRWLPLISDYTFKSPNTSENRNGTTYAAVVSSGGEECVWSFVILQGCKHTYGVISWNLIS